MQPKNPEPAQSVLHALLDVKQAPDEDAPRLILADWLEDQPEPAQQARAEVIRLQCRLAHLPIDHPDRETLLAQAWDQTPPHQAAWLGAQRPQVCYTCLAQKYVRLSSLTGAGCQAGRPSYQGVRLESLTY